MDKKNVLSVKNLNKIYSKKTKPINALNDLNLDVQEGEIFGLLGPNGAGKTTFINILAGTTIKTSGKVNVWGFDLDKNPGKFEPQLALCHKKWSLIHFLAQKNCLNFKLDYMVLKKKIE